MTATIDHLVYACPDLEQAVARFADLAGVHAAAGGQHPGLGTHNALLSLGERTYLEIIAPDPGQQTAATALPYGLGELAEPGLRGWAVAPADLDAAVRQSHAAGFDYGPVVTRERRTAGGEVIRWRMTTYPHDSAVAVAPFLIDWARTPHPAAAAPNGLALQELVICSPEPSQLARRLRVLGLDLQIEQAARPALRAVLTGPHGKRIELGC